MPHLFISVIDKARILLKPKNFFLLTLSLFISACGGSGGASDASGGNYQVSGKITVQRDSDVDLDLNQVTPLNNVKADPQLITNPSTIGGYLSGYAGNYSASNTQTMVFNEDLEDHYRVSLVEGQELQLSVFQADSSLDTIELVLVLTNEADQEQILLDLDEFSSNNVTVPSDGLYTLSLSVSNITSPLLYTLTLSQTISNHALSVSEIKTLSQDFISGEVLIRFKETSQSNSSTTHMLSTLAAQFNKSTNQQVNSKYILEDLALKESIPNIANVYRIQTNLKTKLAQVSEVGRFIEPEAKARLSRLDDKIQTLELINQLNLSDLVEFAEPNYFYYSAATTNDPRLNDQWNLTMLATPAAWEVANGSNVIVAVLDTGIDASHEDLTNNILIDGYDFISDSKSSGDGDGIDNLPDDEGASFHGSHVAGIIAAEADNNLGIAGIAFGSKIMPLRVLGVQDKGSSSDIAQAILYAAGLTNTSGEIPTRKADIVNMSFGSNIMSETVKRALDQATNEGLILIAAAGNLATDELFYPASFDNVMGVGAVSNDKKRSSFSNFGGNVDLVAPGGTGSGSVSFDGFQDAILSTINTNNYTEYVGTSMAAPHVSAVAALMKELKPDLNGQSFKAALQAGFLTQNLSNSTPDTNNFYGHGLIDAAKAVNWAAGSTIIPGIISIYPAEFGFIGANTKAELSLTNPSNSIVKIVSIEEHENWLSISPKDDVDITTLLGTYLVEVNLAISSLDQGTVTVNYQIDNGPIQKQILNVFISRSSQADSTVGVLHVSLFRETDILNDIYQPAYGVGGQLTNGVYHYCFNAIAPGRYLLRASTDNDRDGISFDKGEAVGVYPLISRPDLIEISNSELTNLNFDIQYPSFISSKETANTLSRQINIMDGLSDRASEWLPSQMTSQQTSCLE